MQSKSIEEIRGFPAWVSLKEAAYLIGKNRETIRLWVTKARVRAKKNGNRIMVFRGDVERAVEYGRHGNPPPRLPYLEGTDSDGFAITEALHKAGDMFDMAPPEYQELSEPEAAAPTDFALDSAARLADLEQQVAFLAENLSLRRRIGRLSNSEARSLMKLAEDVVDRPGDLEAADAFLRVAPSVDAETMRSCMDLDVKPFGWKRDVPTYVFLALAARAAEATSADVPGAYTNGTSANKRLRAARNASRSLDSIAFVCASMDKSRPRTVNYLPVGYTDTDRRVRRILSAKKRK
jgi:hypothetical protein